MALVATPGDPDADSYVTLEEFVAHLAGRLHVPAVVIAATDPMREAAARMATLLFDASLAWTGAAATETQSLAWPRTGMLSKNGFAIPDDIIPGILKTGVFEFMIKLLVADRTTDNSIVRQGITSIKAGPVALTFKDSASIMDAAGLPNVIPDIVKLLLPSTWYTAIAAGTASTGTFDIENL